MRGRRGYLILAASLVLPVASFSIAGWHHQRAEHPLVAVIPETTAEELWEGEHAGVAAAVSGTKWHIYWNAPSSEDQVAQQIALVQHIEGMHASGLILAPDHPLALTTVVRQVLSKNIPTVVVSTELPLYPQANLGFVLNDDEAAGSLAAGYVAHLLRGRGDITVLGDNSSVRSATMRAKAFAMALTQGSPGIHLVAESRGSLRLGEAEQQAEDVLRRNPHLAAIVSIGIVQTRGTLVALRSLHLRNKVALIAFDQDLDLMYSLRHDEISAVIAQNTFRMGQMAMKMIDGAHQGAAMPGVTRVAPLLITRANIDLPEAQQILSMDWRAHQP